VAGVSYRQDVVQQIVEGQAVLVERDVDNEYDANACAVTVGGTTVGYVPKALASKLVETADGPWSGVVAEVLRGDTWGLRVRLEGEVDGETGTVPTSDEHEPEQADNLREVTSRSGRVLGGFVRRDGDKIVVKSSSGLDIPYPAELVTVV
jgi:hypothetical protein